MLGWVITCHDDRAQEILDALEKKNTERWSSAVQSISGTD